MYRETLHKTRIFTTRIKSDQFESRYIVIVEDYESSYGRPRRRAYHTSNNSIWRLIHYAHVMKFDIENRYWAYGQFDMVKYW